MSRRFPAYLGKNLEQLGIIASGVKLGERVPQVASPMLAGRRRPAALLRRTSCCAEQPSFLPCRQSLEGHL